VRRVCPTDYEPGLNAKGERYVRLDHAVVSHLRAMRGPGESYSDAIIWLVEADAVMARK
jgi:hypothetical protein